MSEPVFNYPPDIQLLQWLAQGSLKQYLLQAIRLWVWLRSLYGAQETRVKLPDIWTYTDWRDVFFSNTHPKGEKVPPLHDENCSCAKTTADWLFASEINIDANHWKQSIISYYPAQYHDKNDPKANNFQSNDNFLIVYPNEKNNKKSLDDILQHRLFAVTRRTLQEDLYILRDRGWIKFHKNGYQLIDNFPNLDFYTSSQKITNFKLQDLTFSNVNLETTLGIFSEPLGGYRRFYLEVDYIIPESREDVDDCQNLLKEVWSENPNPPVSFTYQSAKLGCAIERVVYPVCIYYARRAIYLCAFGQTPNDQGEWYNYRLDRIFNLKKLDWSDSNLPLVLQKKDSQKLPTPEYIREQIAEAWGYDFYEKRRLLVLRFERSFHDLYIKDTFRHEKFDNITYQQVIDIIKQQPQAEQKALLKVMKKRSNNDAYYKAYYRDKDVNIMHRLRSWRPNGEVLLPWDLRKIFAQEAATEAKLYQD